MKIIANSLPKSGTHLLSHFLSLVGYSELKPNIAWGQIRSSNLNPFYIIQKELRIDRSGNGLSIDLDIPDKKVKPVWLRKILFNSISEGYHKAHLPYSKELETFLIKAKVKLIYIIRDPRDVLLSYYDWVLSYPAHPEYYRISRCNSINNGLRKILHGNEYNDNYFKALYSGFLFKSGYMPLKKYQRNYKVAPLKERLERSIGWWKSDNVCKVKFEELIGDKGGGNYEIQRMAIKKLLKYLEIDLTTDKIVHISENLFNPKANTFNKGIIGRWKKYFDDEFKKEFDNECGYYLNELNYEKNL